MRNNIDVLIAAAEEGNADAQNQLGDAYYNGDGLEQDYTKAFEWYFRAAKQGHALAQYNVAFAYANGLGTQKNMEKAIEWYGKSADQGVALAQYVLGEIMIDGQHIAQDFSKGLELLQKASDQGLNLAQYELGTYYLQGRIVEANTKIGIEYLTLAADQGNKEAQFNLGLAYSNLPEPNFYYSEKYFLEASNNGHFKAMLELSRIYAIYMRNYKQGLLWAIVASEYCAKEDDQRITQIKHRLESMLSTSECEAVATEAREIIARLDARIC
ncbi:MAG: tetratricopeptide repeat protein [Candidatus Cloacimonas sp.]